MLPEVANPDLTAERIMALAQLISEVRAGAVDNHSPEDGDTNKSLGFTAYERTRSTIISTAGSPSFEWLSILTPDGRFTFRIGNTPVRFWKGTPERLPGDKLVRSEQALRQIDFQFHDEPVNSLIWFIIIETNYDKLVNRAFLIGFTESGAQHINWEIPIRGKVSMLAGVDKTKAEGVEMNSAAERLRRKDKGKDHGSKDAGQE